jgi:hypothetical protein
MMSLGLLNWWGYIDDSEYSWVKGFFIPFTAIEEWETKNKENRVVGESVNPAWDKGREWIKNHGPSYPPYKLVKGLEIYPLLSESRIFLPLDYLLPKDGVISAESHYMSSLDSHSHFIMACFERLGGRSLQKLKKIWGSDSTQSLQLALDKWDDLNHSPALVLLGPDDADFEMSWREWLPITRMTEEEFQSAFYYWEDEDWWICIDSGINKAVQRWLQELYSPSMAKGSIMADFNHIQYLAGCDMTQKP